MSYAPLDLWTKKHKRHRGVFNTELARQNLVHCASTWPWSWASHGYGTMCVLFLSVTFDSTRASGIARLLPLQTCVSEVGSLHRHDQCRITLRLNEGCRIGPQTGSKTIEIHKPLGINVIYPHVEVCRSFRFCFHIASCLRSYSTPFKWDHLKIAHLSLSLPYSATAFVRFQWHQGSL